LVSSSDTSIGTAPDRPFASTSVEVVWSLIATLGACLGAVKCGVAAGAGELAGVTGGFGRGTSALTGTEVGATGGTGAFGSSVTGGDVDGVEGGTSGIGGFKPPGEFAPERTGLGGSLSGGSLTGPGGIGANLGPSEAGESFRGSLRMNRVGKRWESPCQ